VKAYWTPPEYRKEEFSRLEKRFKETDMRHHWGDDEHPFWDRETGDELTKTTAKCKHVWITQSDVGAT
jgi:hypothetical protein